MSPAHDEVAPTEPEPPTVKAGTVEAPDAGTGKDAAGERASADAAAFDFDGEVRASMRRLARAHRRYGATTDLNELAETVYADTEERYERLATDTWLGRTQVEQGLGHDFRDVFNTFDLTVGVSGAALRRVATSTSEPDQVPDSVAYAIAQLQVRALRTAHEVCALLRAGFASVAGGRWRTLYEVYITAAVLWHGNRHTCTRFNEHRWIMLARDFRRTSDPQWHGTPTPDQIRHRLIARFGAAYDGTYGWAAELTGRRRPAPEVRPPRTAGDGRRPVAPPFRSEPERRC